VLQGLATAKITFESGLPVRAFWTMVYQTVIEGMYSTRFMAQSQQGRLETDRLPGRDCGASRECREIQGQAVPNNRSVSRT